MLLLSVLVVFLVLPVFSLAQIVNQPHWFFGEVKINGNPAPDGTIIEAKINNVKKVDTKTKDGKYGYSPDTFKVLDETGSYQGKTIEFYVDGKKAGEFVFKNQGQDRLDFSITKTTPPPAPNTGGSGGGGGGGGGGSSTRTTPTVCESKWRCTDWNACSTLGKQTRICVDENLCNITKDKPSEERECTPVSETLPGLEPEKCIPDWSCTEWTACFADVQSRSCNDLNACGSPASMPDVVKDCSGVKTGSELGLTGYFISNTPTILGGVVVLVVIIGGLIYYRKTGKPVAEKPIDNYLNDVQ